MAAPDILWQILDTPMPDGTILRADVARPNVSHPVPILLTRCPYLAGWRPIFAEIFGWDTTSPGAMTKVIQLQTGVPVEAVVGAGFAVVIQACRGTDRSEGRFRFYEDEAADGVATRQALANLDWCDGNILTFGASYLGTTQFTAALSDTQHLKSMTTWLTPSTYYDDLAMRAGVLLEAPTYEWARQRVREGRDHDGLTDCDQEYLPEAVDALTSFLAEVGFSEAARRLSEAHSGGAHAADIAAHPLYDDYWQSLEYPAQALRDLDIPTMHVAGWYDLFLGGTLRNFEEMSAAKRTFSGTDSLSQRLVIGPWTHINQGAEQPGRTFPGGDSEGGDLHTISLNFWRASLGDHEAAQRLPKHPVRTYIMGANQWVDLPHWPPPSHTYEWDLGKGTLGPLTATSTAPSDTSHFLHDPTHPIPTAGGQILLGSPEKSGPHPQNEIEKRPDIYLATSEPLTEPVTILGPIHLHLWVASSAEDAHIHAALSEVSSDGTSTLLTDGVLRLGARHGLHRYDPLTPDEAVEVDIDMWATGIQIPAGHRLRLRITGSNWPRYEVYDPYQGQPVTLTILHDASHRSYLSTPLIDLDAVDAVTCGSVAAPTPEGPGHGHNE
ncbi:MAG: CocE/NonD family hydrolase [Actinomycetaceae bacterium]|nr:CocE/NonD family hydrolase [Actinomycetaceae bacterium]